MKLIQIVLIQALILMISGCGKKNFGPGADANGFSRPTKFTAEANASVLKELPFSDKQDFEQAKKGLIASDPSLIVKSKKWGTVWDMPSYGFIKGDAPASVNPSLWRQAKLNNIHGLFKVTDGIYQLRGYDLANMTIIEGKTGWIIVDPLTTKETAARAIAFAREKMPKKKPIVAMIFTHSHMDHFGGALGIMSAKEAAKNKVRIIAPEGFMKEATSENILAGPVMLRRAMYMFGGFLPHTIRGHIGSGLGKGVASSNFGIIRPTEIVKSRTPKKMIIDGVKFVFMNVPGSEAPAELVFYLPDHKAFCGAEIVSRHMHNLYIPRGAKVRDALKWSGYIDKTIKMFGKADIYFACHHWPIWGNKKVIGFLKKQRDTYKYIHDQTLRLAHAGNTPKEIAEKIELPESLRKTFSSRGYYGTLSHNSKAVYQNYYGWFDGNPSSLNPLPPVEAGKRYVKYMGGADKILSLAKESFDKGEYRWVAEVLKHLVFAEPDNDRAKALLARAYDQLGYQSESGPWRDIYLTGAYELRHGNPEKGISMIKLKDVMKQTEITHFLDAMATRLNGPKAEGKNLIINLVFTDLKESYVLTVENSVLHHKKGEPDPKANATMKLTKGLYLQIATGKAGLKTLMSDKLKLEGSKMDLVSFFRLMSKPNPTFSIVVP